MAIAKPHLLLRFGEPLAVERFFAGFARKVTVLDAIAGR
jgi:hypothetical protein